MIRTIARHALCIAAAATGMAASPGVAQTVPPSYGFDFVMVGDPGNRGATAAEAPMWNRDLYGPLGAVDHAFRITRTEVTNAQYLEFLNAYSATPGYVWDPSMVSTSIAIERFGPSGNPIYYVLPGAENYGADVGFRYAARFANWLHNDKGSDLADFEAGVYDTSTFRDDPVTGLPLDQVDRSPDAKFFIPSIHEWMKAAHWDPNRDGPGQGGFWQYPNGGDEPLVTGIPGEPGSETSAGLALLFGEYTRIDVGLYPDSASPWGMLDASGGLSEMTESVSDFTRFKLFRPGTSTAALDPALEDRLDYFFSQTRPTSLNGFRMAGVVPAPGSIAVMLGCAMVCGRRRA
ncbi:MAG: SUMF1/EgtB/PvdO family nonheme iron enzyme [Phycisphaerales bacterium]